MRFFSSFLLLGTSLATPAFAQQSPAPADTSATDGIIVTASRLALEPREIGSAVTVVTDKDLEAGQIVFVKDVLQDLAGVQVSTDRPGDNTNVSIRGSDNDQVMWLIDGIKLGDPSAISTQFQPDHLVSQDIARIEVLRGNQSSLYGSDAIGGVVNIITQRATRDGVHLNAEGEGGSYGAVNGGASVFGKSGALDFRLTATGYSQDGPSLADPKTAYPAGSATEQDGYWRYGLSGRAGLALSNTLSVQMIGFWQKARSDMDNTTSDSSDFVRKRDYAAAAQANYLSTDKKLKIDASVSRYAARRLYFGTWYAPDGDSYKGTHDRADVNLRYDAGLVAISAGGSLEREKSDQATYYSGNLAHSISTTSGYGELALRPIANLTITGAARVDDNSRFGSFDTYRGTIAYVVPGALGADSVKFRASYGTGAKAPGIYQLYDPTYGNSALKAETSRGGDFGVDMNFERFSAQFSYFYGHTKNEIVWDATLGSYGQYTQYGRTRKQGVEVAFVLEPVKGVSIRQSFTYLDAEADMTQSGAYSDIGRPSHSGSTAITLTPIERLSLTARARYRSRNASSTYYPATAAYGVVDLLASYGLTDRISVYGRVTNLFDKDYQMTYGTNALGRAAYGGVRVSL